MTNSIQNPASASLTGILRPRWERRAFYGAGAALLSVPAALALLLALHAAGFVFQKPPPSAPTTNLSRNWQPVGFAEATLAAGRRPIPAPPREPPRQARANWTPLLDLHPSLAERAAPLPAELTDAILRIEGIYDPTRIGYFGRALRMEVRAGTMSMNNVFADGWMVSFADPNVHRRLRYLAEGWLWPGPSACADFRRVRPHDSLATFDQLSDQDCRWLRARHVMDRSATVVAAPLSLPVFAAPYPGNRLSHKELMQAQSQHALAVRERLRILRPIWMPGKTRPAADLMRARQRMPHETQAP